MGAKNATKPLYIYILDHGHIIQEQGKKPFQLH